MTWSIKAVWVRWMVREERSQEMAIPSANFTALRSEISQCDQSSVLNKSFSVWDEEMLIMSSTCIAKIVMPGDL